MLSMIVCKHLGMIHPGCNMTQMSLHKYPWIMNCSRIRSLANSLHIPLENGISGHRISNTLGMLVAVGPTVFVGTFYSKWHSQASKSLIKSLILLPSQKYDVSLLGKIHISLLSHCTTINILQVNAIFFP